ncbi:Rid family detoxifying hydrolase [Diaphorobacter aerolatus]|uniref:RidA family protein n=1 Tax=Diaphorobacter aerolatus TaxID=1288495 RepID=A0A7H0GMV9_9BURK|nr:Rid family detoxifying hydrolase [Diaphorobacter aerolatus]QNP49625.1 RidA family protein [Diaphorobacter aerolatus]
MKRNTTLRLVLACGAAISALALVGCAAPSKREVLSTNQIYPAIGPYSQMVSHGNTIYFSGVLPLNAAGTAIAGTTIEEQTRAVLDFIGAKLKSQGLGYEDVLATQVYMKDLNEFGAMNKVYGEYFKSAAPARATVEVARLPRDVKIEIAAVVGRR